MTVPDRHPLVPRLARTAVVVALAMGPGACERKSPPSAPAPPHAVPAGTEPSYIEFPQQVQADDPTVNDFVHRISEVGVAGDYERFRLLWSVRETPTPRQEFERGWKALRKVTVRALQKLKTPEGEYLYYIHARLELDESMPEPTREVVLLIVQENGQWRLAKAPAHLRKKVLGTASGPGSEADSPMPGESPSADGERPPGDS